jgi:hypothetical protein
MQSEARQTASEPANTINRVSTLPITHSTTTSRWNSPISNWVQFVTLRRSSTIASNFRKQIQLRFRLPGNHENPPPELTTSQPPARRNSQKRHNRATPRAKLQTACGIDCTARWPRSLRNSVDSQHQTATYYGLSRGRTSRVEFATAEPIAS